MYGVAAYRNWNSNGGRVHQVIADYRTRHYADISATKPTPTVEQIFSDDEGTVADDSQEDPDYYPGTHSSISRHQSSLVKAMDDLNDLMGLLGEMRASGATAEEVIRNWERKIGEETRARKQTNDDNVEEWRRGIVL